MPSDTTLHGIPSPLGNHSGWLPVGKGTHRLPLHALRPNPVSTSNAFSALTPDDTDYTTPWKLDSAASDHYAGQQAGVLNRHAVANGIRVGVANGHTMQQIEAGHIPFNSVPTTSTSVSIFKHMPHSLLGAGRFVLDGHDVLLSDPLATVTNRKTGKCILTAKFDPLSASWNAYPDIPPNAQSTVSNKSPPSHEGHRVTLTANNAYRIRKKADLITFYAGAAGWPVKKTWIAAINNGYFASWPGLTADLVSAHYTTQIPTVMGHLHARRSGIRSTKPTPEKLSTTEALIAPPRPHILRRQAHQVGAHLITLPSLKGAIATDFCGRYPHTSNRGMQYVFVLYDYDSNAILAAPTKSRSGANMIKAYDYCYKQLTDAGITPILQYLDNEVSAALIESIKAKQLVYQLASPHDHRLNPAERHVQTFKNHLVAILNGCDDRFPKYLWCRLIPQSVLTLNMLRSSRINPRLSAHDQLFGTFNYDRTPLAPLGTHCIIHERPSQRGTWDPHGKLGWLTGSAPAHYRHYTVTVKNTGADRVSDSITFLPTKYTLPAADPLIDALDDLSSALTTPHLPKTDDVHHTLTRLQEIFHGSPSSPAALTKPQRTQPPRVSTPRVPPPRVPTQNPPISLGHIDPANIIQKRRIHTASPTIFPNGTTISKLFDDGIYQGKVIAHDARRKLYRILYTDGDAEELSHLEIDKLLHLEHQRARHTSPLERLEHSYYATKASRRPFSTQATYGLALAVTQLRPQWSYNTNALAADAAAKITHYAHAVLDKATGKKLEYRQLIKHPDYKDAWNLSGANEFGRLLQGIGHNPDGTQRIQGTNTCFFIHKHNIPRDKKATYARIVCEERPEKTEVNRTRITAGGDRLEYFGDVSTETAGLTTAKLLFNSVVSTPGARFMTFDISNMYLNTPLRDFQYMRFHMDIIPPEVITEYNLADKVDPDGWVYCEIRRAIYGLKESGRLANDQLKTVLAAADYHPCRFTHGLFTHRTRPISFSLVVDDFGVKYVNKADALHLEKILSAAYPIKTDWTGEYYLGMTLKWDYNISHANRNVTLSMPNYVADALIHFQHIRTSGTYSASPFTAPVYGKQQQMAPTVLTPSFTPAETKRLQKVCGKFLYYARAVDSTMMHALNDLASQTTTATKTTAKAMVHFLNYCATYPDSTITYYASDMIIRCDSDAAYLVAPKARSRAGGYIFLGNADSNTQIINAPIMVIATILKMVVSSAAEAEVAALYHCARELVPLRTACSELGHQQPVNGTPLRTDNSTAEGILNNTVKQKRSKAIDMRFYWLQDRVAQNMFQVTWAPGKVNLADYYTKHHPMRHIRALRPLYTSQPGSPRTLLACNKLLAMSVFLTPPITLLSPKPRFQGPTLCRHFKKVPPFTNSLPDSLRGCVKIRPLLELEPQRTSTTFNPRALPELKPQCALSAHKAHTPLEHDESQNAQTMREPDCPDHHRHTGPVCTTSSAHNINAGTMLSAPLRLARIPLLFCKSLCPVKKLFLPLRLLPLIY